jgi:DegT/DnrJ/EryC1/StrS aminotransferase family
LAPGCALAGQGIWVDKGNEVMKQPPTILTAGPSITSREIEYVLDPVQYGWNENWNSYLSRFECAFAQSVGARFAISTSSYTGALHLALLALGVEPGDEVIVPEITWVAIPLVKLQDGPVTRWVKQSQHPGWCLERRFLVQERRCRQECIEPTPIRSAA